MKCVLEAARCVNSDTNMKRADLLRTSLWSVCLLGLTGCTTYVQTGPPVVSVSPPPVRVEPPRVYVSPPPVYVAPPPGVEVAPTVEIRAESDFYEPLTPYGRWEVIEPYGRCWVPTRIEADWRPYCHGHWERTEAGWYWASDEPWAWATYHYGRWDLHPQFGWYWVPQTRWAPAWVSWHHGGGYLGWAPLHPSVRVELGGPIEVDRRLIPRPGFVFVEEKRFLEPVRPKTVIVNNTTIINKTVNITNVKVVNNTVINEGPRVDLIQQTTGRKIQPVPVHELRHKDEAVVIGDKNRAPGFRSEKVEPVIRKEGEPRENAPVITSPQRIRELHLKAEQESQKNARELERKAQLESELRARELQRQAQVESQRHAKELERKAQLESQQRAMELQQKAREEAQRTTKELQKKAQLESQQRAAELQKKAQEDSQKASKELERKAQLRAEQRAWELHQQAHEKMEKNPKDAEKKAPPSEPQRRGQGKKKEPEEQKKTTPAP